MKKPSQNPHKTKITQFSNELWVLILHQLPSRDLLQHVSLINTHLHQLVRVVCTHRRNLTLVFGPIGEFPRSIYPSMNNKRSFVNPRSWDQITLPSLNHRVIHKIVDTFPSVQYLQVHVQNIRAFELDMLITCSLLFRYRTQLQSLYLSIRFEKVNTYSKIDPYETCLASLRKVTELLNGMPALRNLALWSNNTLFHFNKQYNCQLSVLSQLERFYLYADGLETDEFHDSLLHYGGNNKRLKELGLETRSKLVDLLCSSIRTNQLATRHLANCITTLDITWHADHHLDDLKNLLLPCRLPSLQVLCLFWHLQWKLEWLLQLLHPFCSEYSAQHCPKLHTLYLKIHGHIIPRPNTRNDLSQVDLTSYVEQFRNNLEAIQLHSIRSLVIDLFTTSHYDVHCLQLDVICPNLQRVEFRLDCYECFECGYVRPPHDDFQLIGVPENYYPGTDRCARLMVAPFQRMSSPPLITFKLYCYWLQSTCVQGFRLVEV